MALDEVNKELEGLENLAIIEKFDNSDWATPTVYVKKKNTNKLKMCANFSTGLNYVYSNTTIHYQVQRKLKKGMIFPKLDISEAYLQIQGEEDCAHILKINTRRGLYTFKQFPFGVNVVSAMFQQLMDTMLNDCEFAITNFDDTLIKSGSVK